MREVNAYGIKEDELQSLRGSVRRDMLVILATVLRLNAALNINIY